MADYWNCPICNVRLRCSCSSSECGFDYDIKDHVRADLKKALAITKAWWELDTEDMTRFINLQRDDT